MRTHAALLALGVILGGSVLVGCSGDTATGLPHYDAAHVYWALRLNQHAVNMALTPSADTLRITATPITETGAPLSGLGTVTYAAYDSTVTVDATGLVTAQYTTAKTFVVATLQDSVHRVTHADTVYVQVVNIRPSPGLQTFSLQPANTDSAKRALVLPSRATTFSWMVRAADSTQTSWCTATTCSIQVYYASSDPSVATIDRQTGVVTPHDTGTVVFTATTWAYGQARRDSVVFTIGRSLTSTVVISITTDAGRSRVEFNAPRRLNLGVGAVVSFECAAAGALLPCPQPVDVTFDHPEDVDTASFNYLGVLVFPPSGMGNVAAFGGDSLKTVADLMNAFHARSFPVAGRYRYYSTLFPSDTFELDVRDD